MELILDPTGGIAGDMFAAALISAGADEQKMLDAMLYAANSIGQSSVGIQKTHDGATRLLMKMEHNHSHLAASKARILLKQLCDDLKINGAYADFASQVLEILVSAEKQAHAENTFLTDHHSHPDHGHDHHPNDPDHHHDEDGHAHADHHHNHLHHHHDGHHHADHHHHASEEAWLHEAQDVLIDIVGAAMGLQLLLSPTKAILLKPVSLGGGTIRFSHGEMSVPAPATKIMMDKYTIANTMGPVNVELCTPTGSAILAALGCALNQDVDVHNPLHSGSSRGGKDLDIPPLKLYLKK